MTHLDFDWNQLAEFLPVWHALSVEARTVFLDELAPKPLLLDQLGDQRGELCAAGFVDELTDGRRCRLAQKYRRIRTGLRGMRLQVVFDAGQKVGIHSAKAYLREHLSYAEKGRLDPVYRGKPQVLAETVTTMSWLDSFTAAAEPADWEHVLSPSWYHQEGPWSSENFATGKRLVLALLKLGDPLTFAELPTVSGMPDQSLWPGLYRCCRDALLFVDLNPETLLPRIGIWPEIAAWLYEPARNLPSAVVPNESICLPFLAEDVSRFLALCAVEPRRVKLNGGEIFATVAKEMEQLMVAAPDWVPNEFFAYKLFRVGKAVDFARQCGLVEVEEGPRSKTKPCLAITHGGRRWLERSSAEQVQRMLEAMGLAGDGEGLVTADDFPVPILASCFPFPHWAVVHDDAEEWDVVRAAFVKTIALLAEVPAGAGVDFGDFIHYVEKVHNPFLGPEGQDLCKFFSPAGHFGRMTSTSMVEMWGTGVFRFLGELGVAAGVTVLGTTHDEPSAESMVYFDDYEDGVPPANILVGLSSLGRYCLGLASGYDLDGEADGEVVIQPNFEIVFLGQNPTAEARLTGVAERQGTGRGTLFRITKASVLKAAAAGLDGDRIAGLLSDVSTRPVPKNVLHDVRGWVGNTRYFEWREAVVVSCPDAESALRLSAELGTKAELIGPTKVEIVGGRPSSVMIKKLQKAGLILRSAL